MEISGENGFKKKHTDSNPSPPPKNKGKEKGGEQLETRVGGLKNVDTRDQKI